MRTKVVLIVFVLMLLSVLSLTVLSAEALATSTTNYTFTDVTFSDGTKGYIKARVQTRPAETTCSYYNNRGTFLGKYKDQVSFKTAPEVKRFCLQHYKRRVK
jgi:hypothetical protein